MSMTIVKNGDVHVSVPFGVPREAVMEFITKNQDWIAKAKMKTSEHEKQRAAFFSRLPLVTPSQVNEAMKQLKAIVEPMVEKYAKMMGVHPSAVSYKPTTSRWGQCNLKDRSINISTYLLLFPEWCIEHVVVHEMCHLLEPNHSARFHALMDKYFPRWREARREMRKAYI